MKSFNKIYEEIYKESNSKLENLREHELKNHIILLVVTLIFIILEVVFIKNELMILVFLLLIFYLIFIYKTPRRNVRNKYKEMFKKEVIRKFVNEYNGNLDFYEKKGMNIRDYISGEFERFDRYYSEDSIEGLIDNGNKIHMAEVHTENETEDEEGHTSYSTVFWGLFAKIELEKNIPVNLKIRRDSIIELWNKNEKMNMDSSEFEKHFTVYSTDKIIAMQLLTAEVMQTFIDFKDKNKLIPEITLKNNKMYIRFNTGKIFEGNILKRALDYDTLLKYYNIINFTLKLSEEIVKNINKLDI